MSNFTSRISHTERLACTQSLLLRTESISNILEGEISALFQIRYLWQRVNQFLVAFSLLCPSLISQTLVLFGKGRAGSHLSDTSSGLCFIITMSGHYTRAWPSCQPAVEIFIATDSLCDARKDRRQQNKSKRTVTKALRKERVSVNPPNQKCIVAST